MPSLLDLPNELLLSIASCFKYYDHINGLMQTCSRMYKLLSGFFYRYAFEISGNYILERAVHNGFILTVRKALKEGALSYIDYVKQYDLFSAAIWRGHSAVLELLLEHGIDSMIDTIHYSQTYSYRNPQGFVLCVDELW